MPAPKNIWQYSCSFYTIPSFADQCSSKLDEVVALKYEKHSGRQVLIEKTNETGSYFKIFPIIFNQLPF